jgi:hypothetical protein
MYSREHALVGAAVAAAWRVPRVGDFAPPVVAGLFVYGVGLSVLVDLDHFVVARLLTGDWRHLRRVLADPTAVLGDQDWIFPDLELERERLLSHAVVSAVLIGGWWLLAPPVAAFSAALLGAHVLADVVRDVGIA